MKTHVNVTFKLSEHEKIAVQLRNKADVLDVHYEAYCYFLHYNRRYVISDDFIDNAIDVFKRLLIKAVHNKLQLDPMYYDTIGVYWNHALNKKNTEDIFDAHHDILSKYVAFGSWYTIFIYNDQDGNIIFVLTALYPFTFASGKKKRTYGYFLRWMSRYKTTYRTIIPEDVAHAWIAQAQDILDVIEKNTARLYGY